MSDSKIMDIEQIRADFPVLHQEVNGKPLVYLDNGATTQKPQVVIDAIANYYRTTNSNVHRGAHTLSDQATQMFEDARTTMQKFLNAAKSEEILWTRGTTESINLVAQTWVRSNYDAYLKLLSEKTKFVAVVHVSNALGTLNPVEDIIREAHKVGAKTLIDGAQAVAHWDIDVQALDCDFYAFSGHKLFGPTGLGVLYGKEALLNAMPPYQGGGEMILHVSFEKTTYNVLPYKFEAGTPNIAGAIAMAAAINYLNSLDL